MRCWVTGNLPKIANYSTQMAPRPRQTLAGIRISEIFHLAVIFFGTSMVSEFFLVYHEELLAVGVDWSRENLKLWCYLWKNASLFVIIPTCFVLFFLNIISSIERSSEKINLFPNFQIGIQSRFDSVHLFTCDEEFTSSFTTTKKGNRSVPDFPPAPSSSETNTRRVD